MRALAARGWRGSAGRRRGRRRADRERGRQNELSSLEGSALDWSTAAATFDPTTPAGGKVGLERHLTEGRMPILVINPGSSSIKFSMFAEDAGGLRPLYEGEFSGIGEISAALEFHDSAGRDLGAEAGGVKGSSMEDAIGTVERDVGLKGQRVGAAVVVGQNSADNQRGSRWRPGTGLTVLSVDGQAQRNFTYNGRYPGHRFQERRREGSQSVARVSHVVIEELVVAENSSRRDSKIHPHAVGVHGCVPVLEEQSFRTLVDAAVRRPGHVVARKPEAKAHPGLRKQG